jgi:hypothetical protein
MLIFNLPGILIFVAAFSIAGAVGGLVGVESKSALMVAGGALVVAGDLTYRLARSGGHWIEPNRGGSLFFFPAWCLGVLWMALGIAKSLGLVDAA